MTRIVNCGSASSHLPFNHSSSSINLIRACLNYKNSKNYLTDACLNAGCWAAQLIAVVVLHHVNGMLKCSTCLVKSAC